MDLSLETAEKYFWTWLDFVCLRPKRFSEERQSHPSRYLSPGQFFLGSLIICTGVWLIAMGTLQQVANEKLRAYFAGYFGGDPKLFVARHALYLVAAVIFGTLPQRFILRWPLKSPANITDLLTAKFYCSAVFAAGAAFDALLTCVLVLIIPYVSSAAMPLFLLVWSGSELLILGSVFVFYDLLSVGAFARLRIRRLFEGSFILGLALSAFACPIGAMIGSYFDHESGTPYDWSFALILGIFLLPLVLFIWVVRKRLPKLRALVQAEYAAFPIATKLPDVQATAAADHPSSKSA